MRLLVAWLANPASGRQSGPSAARVRLSLGAVASAFRTANCEVRHTRRGRSRATIAFVKNGGTRNDYRNQCCSNERAIEP